ncbi:EamA family transporter [Vibrio sp. HA2012]|uniref:DMT family transporter n=1 Tax=Vibrio sp. HA2012 TaxID=1971595 RepID=UPI000C2BEDBF|nr:DMT family transporter [Vibrio sp. HA2012]PJC87216.1 EamA family transporter [Vibrio sp. HA2012]
MSVNNRAVLFMLISTLSLSFSGFFAKQLTGLMSVEFLGFLRLLIPSMLLFLTIPPAKQAPPSRKMLKPVIIRALCIVGCQLCFLISLGSLSLVESVVLFATGPLFIPVLERLFFKVKIRIETGFALAATFVGVMLLAGDVSGIQIKPELLLGLAAGVFNAGSQVSLFRASKGDMSPASLNAWTFLFGAISIFPVLFFSGLSGSDKELLFSADKHIWVWGIMLLYSVAIVLNQLFRSRAYKLAESNSQIAPLIFTNLLFTAALQLVFFDVHFSDYQIAGIALIITASLMNSFAARILKFLFHAKTRRA